MLNTIYLVLSSMLAAGGIIAMLRNRLDRAKKRHEKNFRHAVALERNTEATERLSLSVEKIADKIGDHDKRLDRVEYKLWGI